MYVVSEISAFTHALPARRSGLRRTRMNGWTEWLVDSRAAPSATLGADADRPVSLGKGGRGGGLGGGVERTLPFVLGMLSELWLISVMPSSSTFF